jgi:hypothetical protein
VIDTPPPHDQLPPRSILSRRTEDDDIQNERHLQDRDVADKAQTQKPSKKHRKRVILLDPRTELPDETLKVRPTLWLSAFSSCGGVL